MTRNGSMSITLTFSLPCDHEMCYYKTEFWCVCVSYILRQLRVSVRALTLFSMLSIF